MGLEPLPLAPGFRFHPTDAELFVHYLIKKVKGEKVTNGVIGVLDIYKHEPWDLPGKAILPSRDTEWYFFSSPDRKYPRGSRTSRTTAQGFWKATGKDRKVFVGKKCVGVKKTLVFYIGRVPKGVRTDWVMYEYRIDDEVERSIPNGQEFVLCRVRRKSGPGPRNGEQFGAPVVDEEQEVGSPSSASLPGLSESLALPQPDCPDNVNHVAELINSRGLLGEEALDGIDDLDALLEFHGPAYNDVLSNIATVVENGTGLLADFVRDFDGGMFEVQPRQPLGPELMAPSWGEDVLDLIHPSFEEAEMLEELAIQASTAGNENNPVDSLLGGEMYDGLAGDYLELDDLEVPIENFSLPFENVIGEPERQEEGLISSGIDGWFMPRMRQSLDLGEIHTPGAASQRVHLQVPARSLTDQEHMAEATASSSTLQAPKGNLDRGISTTLEVSGHSTGIILPNCLDSWIEKGASTSNSLPGSSIAQASLTRRNDTFVSKQTSAASTICTHKQLPSHVFQAECVWQDRDSLEGKNTTVVVETSHYGGTSSRASLETDDFDTGIGKGGVVERTSLEVLKRGGPPDSVELVRLEGTLAGASSQSKASSPRSFSRLFYGVLSAVPTKPAFAAELPEAHVLKAVLAKHSSGVLPVPEVTLPGCSRLQADNSSKVASLTRNTSSSISFFSLRAKAQNATKLLPAQGPDVSSSTTFERTRTWARPCKDQACKMRSGGLRVLFRVATTALIFACLLQGFGRLTMSALTIF